MRAVCKIMLIFSVLSPLDCNILVEAAVQSVSA